MMIYMTHPQHGAMHVYAEAEAVANEKNGWVRVAEAGKEPTEAKIEQAQPVAAPEAPIALTIKRGPGRPKKE